MAVSSTNRKTSSFVGNDIVTALPFSFWVSAAADVKVIQSVDATGIETVLTITTHYTVVLNDNQSSNPGGTVTLVTALPTGDSAILTSNLDNLQAAVLSNQGGFLPKVIETALDKIVIMVQQLNERGDRTITVPISAGLSDLEIVGAVANGVIKFNAALDGLDVVALADFVASQYQGNLTNLQEGDILTYDSASALFINSRNYIGMFTLTETSANLYDLSAGWAAIPPNGNYDLLFPTTNTGAVTMTMDGVIGTFAVEDSDSAALAAGDIIALKPMTLYWNGTEFRLPPAAEGGGGSSDIIVPVDLIEFDRAYKVNYRTINDVQGLRCIDAGTHPSDGAWTGVTIGFGEIDTVLPTIETSFDLEMRIGMSGTEVSKNKNFTAYLYLSDVDGNFGAATTTTVKTSEAVPDDETDIFTITWSDFITDSNITVAGTRVRIGILIEAGTGADHSYSVVVQDIRLMVAA